MSERIRSTVYVVIGFPELSEGAGAEMSVDLSLTLQLWSVFSSLPRGLRTPMREVQWR